MGPESAGADEVLDEVVKVMFATQQAEEEELGAVELRPREGSLEDIAWNAVVVGHPNRFEDVAEASQYGRSSRES